MASPLLPRTDGTSVSAADNVTRIAINYQAEPIARKFHASKKRFRCIKGPRGSGKSTACVMEIWRIGTLQAPDKDGIRRTRWLIVRNTYGELENTTIKTWKSWFPVTICPLKFSQPITGTLRLNDVEIELVFLAMDREDDVAKLLSLEATGVYLNELKELPQAIIGMCLLSIGRYPPMKDGDGPTRSCVIADTNPPDVDHWYYHLAEEEKPEDWDFFTQPGGLIRISDKVYIPNPRAENIRNLKEGYGYYFGALGGQKKDWITVYILGEYGPVVVGRPCYPTYSDTRHRSEKPLEVLRGLPLRLGWDYGRTPAVIVAQLSVEGQLRVLREILVDADGMGMGVRKFAHDHVVPYLQTEFPGMSIRSRGDPAGKDPGQNDENSAQDILAEEGIPTEPASSNAPEKRLDDVEYFLNHTLSDGKPAFIMDPSVRVLRRGFNGGYHMRRVQVAGEARYRSEPEKNWASHPHDALQYVADDCRNLKVEIRTAARPVQPARRFAQ